MVVRPEISRLARQLSASGTRLADDNQQLLQSLVFAGELLRKFTIESALRAAEAANHRPSIGPEADVSTHMNAASIRRLFQASLNEPLLSLEMTSEEADTLAQPLIRLLDGPPTVAKYAANAFIRTNVVSAVPKLLKVIGQYPDVDSDVTHQAISAVGTILGRNVDATPPVDAALMRIVREAIHTLVSVRSLAAQTVVDPEEVATREIRNFQHHFHIRGRLPGRGTGSRVVNPLSRTD